MISRFAPFCTATKLSLRTHINFDNFNSFRCFSASRFRPLSPTVTITSSSSFFLQIQQPSVPLTPTALQFSSKNMGTADNKEEGRVDNNDRPSSQPPTKLLTLPTILTLARVAAIPLLVTTFYSNSWWATTVTTSIFVAAAITDWLDGYIARKMRLGTPFGAFLDPVADKLMVAATLVLLCTKPLEVGVFGEMQWLLPIPSIAIIGREVAWIFFLHDGVLTRTVLQITMSAVREWAASQNGKVLEAVAVNNLGKWKTATQMIALTILLATRDDSIVGSHILVPTGVTLLYVSAGVAVWSLAVYMRKIWRILLKL
ncbi:hypothetical protein IFM89_019039 [Coptis chinensis]|uniref:CDP-diacylglycerol--glycerol-3-phosphate 3-phosphatidyltransferase n=1 Tax=Coptis chinensis TaxID=261450 RepID=A0A835HFU2_9MAGN|nr:hypothetical protein IFM89_019039 [Coptis chinensis]